ncbi:hypothetical protein ACQKWADRAFT_313027 [Trichoderma austrokoningii]
MSLPYFVVVAFLALAPMACAQPSIGPASFAFPLPRQWNASFDNVPPCGSSSVGLRTEFPLTNGYLVFTSTYETRDLEMKISHNRNPQSVADFSYLVPWRISDYGVGFTCVKIPDAPGGTEPGANATFQIRFASDYDTPLDRSFFVCADITYVEGRDFDRRVPCANTTDVKFERLPLPRTQIEPPKNATTPGKKKKHLSQGAIAGIASEILSEVNA